MCSNIPLSELFMLATHPSSSVDCRVMHNAAPDSSLRESNWKVFRGLANSHQNPLTCMHLSYIFTPNVPTAP